MSSGNEFRSVNKQIQFHEDLRREHVVAESSDRAFGVVFCVVFAIIGLWPLLGGEIVRWWSLIIAGAFLLLALIWPRALAPLNRLWAMVGRLLHRIVNPLVMGLIFYLTVLPTGLIMRMLGKDLLNLKWDRDADTYWVDRDPPGPSPESIKNQF